MEIWLMENKLFLKKKKKKKSGIIIFTFPWRLFSYSVVKHDHDLEATDQKQFFFKK